MLYAGLRGSHCINLDNKNSDCDVLIVDDCENSFMNDCVVYSRETFFKSFRRLGFEVVEALFNELNVNESFAKDIKFCRESILDKTDAVKYLFWYQVWSMLKNQIKQYYKNDDIKRKTKFLSKSLLYAELLKDENIIEYWLKQKEISDSLKEQYFSIRKQNSITDEQKRKIQSLLDWRANDENRRKYRLKYEQSLLAFEKEILQKEQNFV